MIVNIDENDGGQPSEEETPRTVHPPPKERGRYFLPEDVDTRPSNGDVTGTLNYADMPCLP